LGSDRRAETEKAAMDFAKVAQIYTSYKATPVSQVIHPNDVMYKTGQAFYYTVGEDGVRAILRGLSYTWRADVQRILDLPCGHGRVGRHLRTAFPAAQIFYCEIDREGADFCAETFGGTPLYSEPDLMSVKLPDNLDVIWVGSLFTHLDLRRTTAWLAYLAEHLSEHGIIVATFHGRYTLELAKTHLGIRGGADWDSVVAGRESEGHGFAMYPNNFGVDGYGVSASKASKIMDIAEAIPGTRTLSYSERGWANNHDVLVLGKHDRLRVHGK
jgi:SAM-dependent methyltransferase